MIKVTDIRIGNWVNGNYNGFSKDVQIYAISHTYIQHSTENDLPIANFKPIELTEEWLKKFGFEYDYDQESKSWSLMTSCEKFDYLFEISNKYQEYFQPDFLRIDIKYVHQLQNLYYALTGTELELMNN